MKIGIAGPVSLNMLAAFVKHGDEMPAGYLFAPMGTWVEALLQKGHQVSLFTSAPEIASPRTFTGKQLTIHVGRYRARGRARDLFKQEQLDLLHAMRKDPVDILHAHWTYEFALAALDSGYSTLVTAHDAPLTILKINRDPYRLFRALMAWRVCRRAPVMTAVSSYVAKHLRHYFQYKQTIHIIPNGIPASIFDLHEQSQKRPCNKKIVFASNLTGWAGRKNGQVLVKAFAQLRRIYPDCELWMFGYGHGPGEPAQEWVQRRGLAEGIQFRGQIPYALLLQELSKGVDVLVHPALEESFSMAIAEAMALGIPVIGGKHSGAVPDTLKGGGLLVDVRSPSEMMQAMFQLASDSQLRVSLGNAGFQIARENYRLSHVTDQYIELYRQLTSSVS